MRTTLVGVSLGLAAGHGHLTLPPSTRMGGSLSRGGDCTNGACYWFTNNVEITVNSTLPVEARSVTNGGSPDVFATSPWRAPGNAKVLGSGCGVAGGGPKAYANGGTPPRGIAQNTDGTTLAAMEPTIWQLGSGVEVAWAIAANHGGGYHYRLCKKSDGISEECFQRTPLKFAGNTSFIINPDGSTFEFPMTKVTQGTWPAGSEWARDPVPGCKMCEDSFAQCGAPLPPVPLDQPGGGYTDAWNAQVDCYGACCGSSSSKQHGVCPQGTEFYPAVSGRSGFGKNVPEWSIMDKVIIPADLVEGEYLLGWRWDCEESTQVWQNCADIRLTKDVPPPAPAPVPTPPAPSPKPSKTCKASENPTCKGTFTDAKSCWTGGCQKCHDETTYNCDVCCGGCDAVTKAGKAGNITYCDLHKSGSFETLV